MTAALLVEWCKLRRSPVTLAATLLLVVVLPLLGLGLVSLGEASAPGVLGQKAELFLLGEGWTGYLGAVDQVAAAAVLVGAGVVVAWVFGREHADRTFPALFALPVPRATIATAKFVVLAGWALALSAILVLVTVATGAVAGVGSFELAVHGPELLRLLAVVLSTTLLALPVGWVASAGRGYLPAVGAVIVLVAAAQLSVLFGAGGWFPFAVPGLLAVAGAPGAPTLGAAQLALVPATVALGVWLTVRWWRTAESV